MKVKELIEELEKIDPELNVFAYETGSIEDVQISLVDGLDTVVLSEYGVDQ